MTESRLAGAACRKPATSPSSLRTLLAGALLLSAAFQACLAATVPGTVADGGMLQPAAALPQLHDGYTPPRSAGVDGLGMAESDPLSERRSSIAPAGDRPSGVYQADTDAPLLLFVLLGFAAIAAVLVEAFGRKE